MTIGRFLAGIGALLWNPADDTYLLLQRSADKDYGAGTWECVTGRVDQGESYEQALRREVREEIGVEVHIEFIVGTSHFYRGEEIPENELLGVIYGCTTPTHDAVQIGAEHAEARWMTAQEALALLPPDNWLVCSIQHAEVMRELLPPALRDYHREHGFETS